MDYDADFAPSDVPDISLPPLAFRDVPWTWGDLLLGLAPLVAWRLSFVWAGAVGLSEAGYWTIYVVGYPLIAWMIGFPIWAARRRGARFVNPPVLASMFEFVLAIPLLLGVWILLFVVHQAMLETMGPTDLMPPMHFGPGAMPRWIFLAGMGLLVVLMGPLCEEVFFRGLLYNGLRQRTFPAFAVIVQAVLFGAYHPNSVTHSISVGVFAIVLALVYEWRKTLVTSFAMHAFYNAKIFGVTLSLAMTPVLGVSVEPEIGGGEVGGAVIWVEPGSAAATAGIQRGDVIVSLDRQRIASVSEVAAIVKSHSVGDAVVIEFVRDGREQRVEAVLKSRLGW